MINFIYQKQDNSIQSELSIQKEVPSRLVLVDDIEPYNNHYVYEIDQFHQTIEACRFESNKVIHWFEALNRNYNHYKLIKKPNCIYISSLNIKNLIKKVKSKYLTDISMYKHIKTEGITGSYIKVDVLNRESL